MGANYPTIFWSLTDSNAIRGKIIASAIDVSKATAVWQQTNGGLIAAGINFT
jgi:hypothetical protein